MDLVQYSACLIPRTRSLYTLFKNTATHVSLGEGVSDTGPSQSGAHMSFAAHQVSSFS
jgi:hypothetical protein